MATENLSRIASDFETQLSGAISIGATSFTIQSVTDLDGNTLSDGIYCFTIDRDSTGAKEYLIGQLTNATKTVSSISSVGRQGVLTANAQRAHRIGANVIISDHSILAAISRIFSGQGTINPAAPLEYTTAPTLSSNTQLATVGYVLANVTGGTINTDRIILGSQTAGETVATGNIVYFKSSDSRWWLADADLTATFSDVQLGVALGAGTAGNPITGGVQIYGKCDSFTGLTATATYYLSNTAGAVSSSAGTNTIVVGQAFATTGIFFNPGPDVPFFVSTSAGAGDSGKGAKLNASGVLDQSFTTTPIVRTYLNAASPATWTKPTGLKYVIVEVQGAGGAGGGSNNSTNHSNGCGGGGGGYSRKLIAVASLGATETVTIGAGGTGVSVGTGNTGATSSFGSHCSATGGTGGGLSTIGAGGIGSSGDINITGGGGTAKVAQSGGDDVASGSGGCSFFGGGAKGIASGSNIVGDVGGVYGGGGAGSNGSGNNPGGAGGAGIVIVTEYYN